MSYLRIIQISFCGSITVTSGLFDRRRLKKVSIFKKRRMEARIGFASLISHLTYMTKTKIKTKPKTKTRTKTKTKINSDI